MSDDEIPGSETNVFNLIPGGKKDAEKDPDYEAVARYLEDPLNLSTMELGLCASNIVLHVGPSYAVGLLIMQAIKLGHAYMGVPKEQLRSSAKELIDIHIDGLYGSSSK